jgi:hypothetical protein
MSGKEAWKKVTVALARHERGPGGSAAAMASPSKSEAHQRRLIDLTKRGVPVWSEERPVCDHCLRRLLAGEPALLLQRDGELSLSCPLCAQRLLRDGWVIFRPAVVEGVREVDGGSQGDGRGQTPRRRKRKNPRAAGAAGAAAPDQLSTRRRKPAMPTQASPTVKAESAR